MTYNQLLLLLGFYLSLHIYQVEELGFESRQTGVYIFTSLKGNHLKHEFKILAPKQKFQISSLVMLV